MQRWLRQGLSRRALRWVRVALGLSILVAVIVWISREGTFLKRLSLEVFLWSGFASLVTAMLHALTLGLISRIHGRTLDYRQALRITALGSLGNAAGGIPLGTAVKFGILHQRVGLSLGQITFGLATVSFGISLWLLLYCATSALWLDLSGWFQTSLIAVLGAALLATAMASRFLRHGRLSALATPYLKVERVIQVAGLSFLVATSFVLNFCAVGMLLLPDPTIPELVFVCASGTLLGLVTLLQSIAGTNELAMALMAHAVGIKAADGAQIALTLRATALATSAIILGLHSLWALRENHARPGTRT